MRKAFLLLIAAILCATLLLGCSPANSPSVNTPAAEATPAPDNTKWSDDDGDSEFDSPDDGDDDQYYIDGPVLIVDMSEGYIDNYECALYDDGSYFEEMYYDAMVYITAERLLPSGFGEELETMAMYAGVFEEEMLLTEIELPNAQLSRFRRGVRCGRQRGHAQLHRHAYPYGRMGFPVPYQHALRLSGGLLEYHRGMD